MSANRALESSERVVDRERHRVELVAGAAHRDAAGERGDVDGAARRRQLGERLQRAASHPAAGHDRHQQHDRRAPEQELEKLIERDVNRLQPHADLEQIDLAGRRCEQAVRHRIRP
jgi:hypothetical protein